MELLAIEILNWEKYNPKRDQTTYTWLRLNNDIVTDKKLFGLDAEQKLVWIAILCDASRENSSKVEVNIGWLEDHTKVSVDKIRELIKFLVSRRIIELRDNPRPQTTADDRALSCGDRARSKTTPTRRDERDERDETLILAPPEATARDFLDLESLYRRFPRKKGKSAGLKIAKRDVRDRSSFEQLSLAIDRFLEHHRAANTQAEFVPYFSTFMSHWRDWLDPDHGTSESFTRRELGILEILELEKKAKEESRASA